MAKTINMNDMFNGVSSERVEFSFSHDDEIIVVKMKKKAFLQVSMFTFYSIAKGILRDQFDITITEDNELFEYLQHDGAVGHNVRKAYLDAVLENWNDIKLQNILELINTGLSDSDDEYVTEIEFVLVLAIQAVTTLGEIATQKKN